MNTHHVNSVAVIAVLVAVVWAGTILAFLTMVLVEWVQYDKAGNPRRKRGQSGRKSGGVR